MKNLKWIIFCHRELKVLQKQQVIFRNLICIILDPMNILTHIQKCKEAVNIPIIASLNGVSTGGWTEYARKMQEAGADALELNSYYLATDPAKDPREIEDNYIEVLKAVKKAVTIPVALNYLLILHSLSYMAKRFDEVGADALVLFNRFYQPDIDLGKSGSCTKSGS